jgi:TBC1 domain family member 2
MVKETLVRKREEYTDMIEHYFGLIGFESVE